jgi:GntR family transcriptional regulator
LFDVCEEKPVLNPVQAPLPSGSQPLYLQVYGVLRSRLEAGRWAVGSVLPSIPELMSEFGTSRVTVRQALAMLEAENIIRKRRGVGTTVERDMSHSRWVNIPTSLAELVSTIDAIQPRVLNLEHDARLPDVPMPDDEKPATSYVRMRRVHAQNDHPYCIVDLVLDATLYARDPEKFRSHVVISVMAQLGDLQVTSARQQLTIRVADHEEAVHLQIQPGEPVAEVRRTIANELGVVVYAAVVLYPSRVVRLDMNLLTS